MTTRGTKCGTKYHQIITVMSSLRKRNKKYYIRFTKFHDGERQEKCFSLGLDLKPRARDLQEKIDQYIEINSVNPFAPYFNFQDVINEVKQSGVIECQESLKEFLDAKQHRSARTRKAYEENIGYFFRYCHIRQTPVSLLTQRHFEKFLRREDVKPVTLKTNKRHIIAWWRWMVKKKYVKNFDPISDIDLPYAAIQYIPKMLTEGELITLFEKYDEILIENRKRKSWRPDYEKTWFKPAIAIFFYTGCRLNEVGYDPSKPSSGLRAQNITSDHKYIYIYKAKRDRERFIPIDPDLAAYLEPYLKKRGDIKGDEFVFVNRKGFPITGRTMRETFNDILDDTDIPNSRTIHGMRHNRITTWLEDGYSLKNTKEMGGHYSSRMTDEVYSHLVKDRLYDQMMEIRARKEQRKKEKKES